LKAATNNIGTFSQNLRALKFYFDLDINLDEFVKSRIHNVLGFRFQLTGNRKEMRNMKKQASSRTCFVCGRDNDISLKMSWYEDHEAQQVRATVTVPEHFRCKAAQWIIILRHYILKTIAMFAFTRFYLRVLADLNEIIRWRQRNVILTTAI